MTIQNTAISEPKDQKISTNLVINPELAYQFLDYLDSQRVIWTFQTFDDNSDRKDRSLTRILNGALKQHLPSLVSLNQRGAGVFVTINRTDGKGRKTQNITNVIAVWIEDDEGSSNPPLEPHISVESSPGKFHHYFLLSDATKADFRRLQDELVCSWGSDPNAKDISRVLRLPGFYHQKVNRKKGLDGHPHMVRIVGGMLYDN